MSASPDPRRCSDAHCELPGGLRLCYRTAGDPAGEPLLLIVGLGLHLTYWPPALIQGLAERGYYVICFDNRDVGRSSRWPAPPPGLLRTLLRRPRADGYSLADMADDAVALLDHLGLSSAHLVGMSMGGMIGQCMAARHPERCRSLISIFSTTGNRRVGQPAPSTLWRLIQPPARSRAQAVEKYLGMVRHIAGGGFAVDEQAARAYAAEAWERGQGASAHEGVARQIAAIFRSGDRTAELRRIQAPTLVIHGDADPLVHPSGGRATAEAIAGARHVTIPGMRHYIAEPVVPRLLELIAGHARAPGPTAAQAAPRQQEPS